MKSFKYVKYITALAFYLFFGRSVPMGLLGLFVGMFVSFKLSGGLVGQLGGFGNVGGMLGIKTERQSVFFETAFTLMGAISKSDGRVSEQEIKHVEIFMERLGMSAAHRKKAIGHFQAGTINDFDIGPLLETFNAATAASPNLKQMLMVYLVGVALADGQLHADEASLMREISRQLGYSEQAFEQLMAMIQGQDQFSGGGYHQRGGQAGAGGVNAALAIDAAYQALGVAKSDSDAGIKQTYRRLMSQYHPDKLMGQGLPEEMVKEATERSQEIQSAYELIKKARGMR
ncbi:MAG: co-chaperone DjlA [Granulosicoccus sp.]